MPFLILRIGFWLFLQVAQVLLTLPYSFSQLGMLSGIIFQVFYGILGSWTAYLISVLYVEYRSRKEKENANFKNHVIQVSILPILARRKFQFLAMPKVLKPILIHSLVFFFENCLQWFEVLDGLLGPYWKAVGLAFNCTFLLCGSVIQLIGCARSVIWTQFLCSFLGTNLEVKWKMGFSFAGGLLKD